MLQEGGQIDHPLVLDVSLPCTFLAILLCHEIIFRSRFVFMGNKGWQPRMSKKPLEYALIVPRTPLLLVAAKRTRRGRLFVSLKPAAQFAVRSVKSPTAQFAVHPVDSPS